MEQLIEHKEIWKPIKGYEGLYEISSIGNIKRLSRVFQHPKKLNAVLKEKILKIKKRQDGYVAIFLFKNGVKNHFPCHQLVGEAFLKNVNNYKYINHKNKNKSDNRVENLEWVNHRENMSHAFNESRNLPVGVSMCGDSKLKPYRASISYNGKSKYLGVYSTPEAASIAYNKFLKSKSLKNKYSVNASILR